METNVKPEVLIDTYQLAKDVFTQSEIIKELKANHDLIKEVTEERLKSMEVDDFQQDGIIMHYKKRTIRQWKEEEFTDEMEARGLLHLVKTVKKSFEPQFNLASFQMPTTKYGKLYHKIKGTKEEQEARKKALAEIQDKKRKELQLKQLDELILLFKENKKILETLEERYENNRSELLDTMLKEQISEVSATDDNSVFFKLYDNQPEYDTEAIITSDVEKRFLFLYQINEKGNVLCKDCFTGETFEFHHSADYDGHTLSLKDNLLWIDEYPLSDLIDEALPYLKKKEAKDVEKGILHVSTGNFLISGADFLKNIPTSSTKVDKLIEKGILKESEVAKYRYVESGDDITLHFEMIEEEKDIERRSFFHQKRINTAMRLLKEDQLRIRLEDVENK